MDITYWYLFPLGIIISAMAMSAGISGANFWIPVYLFILKLDPLISFWLALLTMVFGFGSGVVRNLYQHTVNWYIVAALTRMNPIFIGALIENWSQLLDIMIFVVPSVVIGGQLGPRVIKNINAK